MNQRFAACSCGKLTVTCTGDPVRVSICHCLECQRRTGSAFGTQARFRREAARTEGPSKIYRRQADSGNDLIFHFCPECGSTVYWHNSGFPDVIAVAVGAFADPDFPAPRISVYELRRHRWVAVAAIPGIEHHD